MPKRLRQPPPDPAVTDADHLGIAGRKLYDSILAEYEVTDSASEALLLAACHELDVATEADQLVLANGMSYRDGNGVLRVNPFVRVAREARLAMTRALRAMGLDLEPIRDRVGRPFGS